MTTEHPPAGLSALATRDSAGLAWRLWRLVPDAARPPYRYSMIT
ncbi:MAG: hypothetical protein WAK58_02095 [Trebonia sp.]